MRQGALWPGLGVLTLGVGAFWYLRRPRRVVAPVSPPSDQDLPAMERPSAHPAVLTQATVATWLGGSLAEQAVLMILDGRLVLEGTADKRLRLDARMDATLETRVGNGTDQDLAVVVEGEIIRADTGSLVSALWVRQPTGDVRRAEVRIPAHQVVTLQWVAVQPAKDVPAGVDLQVVVAVAAGGQVTRYAGTVFTVSSVPSEGQALPAVLPPPGRWEALERI